MKLLCDYLKEHPEITKLDLRQNKIAAAGAAATLATLTTVTYLILSDNKIGNNGFAAFAGNSSITELRVSDCGIGKEVIPAFLKENKTLTTLDISQNLLDDRAVAALVAGETIKILDASRNLCSLESIENFKTGNLVGLANMLALENRSVPSLQRLGLFAVRSHGLDVDDKNATAWVRDQMSGLQRRQF